MSADLRTTNVRIMIIRIYGSFRRVRALKWTIQELVIECETLNVPRFENNFEPIGRVGMLMRHLENENEILGYYLRTLKIS
jgi:hypothetical protein